jgi:pilus assembly protein CpaC
MAPSPDRLCGLSRSGLALRVLVAGLLLCSRAAFPAGAQPPPVPAVPGEACPAPGGGLCPPPTLTGLPPIPTTPPGGPNLCNTPPVKEVQPKTDEVAKLVESARCNDALIEVIEKQTRIVTVKTDLQTAQKAATIYIGDPTIADVTFVPPPDPKVITPRPALRVRGIKVGVTDLVLQTPDDRIFKFEVRVIPDPEEERTRMQVINAQLHALYPDASLRVSPAGKNYIVEGEARSTEQVRHIIDTINSILGVPLAPGGGALGQVNFLQGGNTVATTSETHVINLIRVPGTQQVLLKVRVAELNRTAMRQIGADFLVFDKSSPFVVGTSLGNSSISASGILNGNSFLVNGTGSTIPGLTTTFGIFNHADFEYFLSALRRNSLLKILAEPNLVAMNGQRANFLAGGQFFIPTAQTSIGSVAGGVTATPVDFGVRLEFLAHILDGDMIRLTVDPSVSQPDFTVATTLVAGGSPVPGLNKRSAHTTVEMRQGQTLAIAGLLSLTLDGSTSRIPGLGDLPILGPFFSNTSGSRTEKELIVLVTPYLVEPMNPDQVPPSPGDEVKEPNDLEFYLLNRIEGRTGEDFRSTVQYDDALHVLRCLLRLHQQNVRGPQGYCD